ncbi:jg22368, partial [Pararge aegeria aegeria]
MIRVNFYDARAHRHLNSTSSSEYVLQGELPTGLVSEESRFDLLEEALQLVELGDEADTKDEQTQ